MSKYICQICGYVYDEDNNPPFDQLPDDWKCPLCGATKSQFYKEEIYTNVRNSTNKQKTSSLSTVESNDDIRVLTYGELASICSNLARGCEKQYLDEQSALFTQLAEYYIARADKANANTLEAITTSATNDLSNIYPNANKEAANANDRGAKRVLVWSEKVTRILTSMLKRYEKEGNSILEENKIWVCDICGFVYIGKEPPQICPICKVPSFRILEVN